MQPRTMILVALLALVALAIPGTASAQAPYQGGFASGHSDNPNGPTVSPYMNLLQNNNVLGPPTNYQSLVKPLIDQQSAIRRQGNSINQLQQQVNSNGPNVTTPGGRATGHQTYFQNLSHYFPRATGGQPR